MTRRRPVDLAMRASQNRATVRRIPAIFLLLAMAALGSGALRYAHDAAHAADHAHADPHGTDRHHDHQSPVAPHDEGNCFIHAQLKLPMLSAGFLPALAFLGLFVAFFFAFATPAIACSPISRFDSRGPPAR